MRSIAVLGAGNGGLAAAADLTLRGFDVRLFSRSAERVAAIGAHGGIDVTGPVVAGSAPVAVVTSDLAQAVRGAELVMLTVPATGLGDYAAMLAPLLDPAQPVFLNPGGTGGALAFAHALRSHGGPAGLPIGESSTLSYACRSTGPAEVTISNVVPELPFATFPGRRLGELADLVSLAYPGLAPAGSVLETGLANINAIEHPAQTLMNAGWIEHTRGDFYFYYDGTTPAVGAVIDAVDAERLAVAAALGVPATPFVQLFASAGYTTAEAAARGTAYDALRASEPNRWFRAPQSLDHRYLHEDVGCGLVPWAAWARIAGVCTPVVDGLVALAGAATGIDYRTTGRTLGRMGLAGVEAGRLPELLQGGHPVEVAG